MFTFSQYKPDYFYLNFDKLKLNEWKKKNSIDTGDSFYHIWQKRKKNIIYIALDNKDKKKNLAMIDKIFKFKKIDIILLPNIANEEGVNPVIIKEDIPQEENEVISLIKTYTIPYIGYLKNDDQLIKKALIKNFEPEDILLFLFLFLYVFCEKKLKKDIKFFSQMIKEIMPDYQKFIEKEIKEIFPKISYNDLFEEYYGFYFNYGVTSVKLISPDKDSKYTIKKLSYLNMVEDNKFTLKVLYRYINKHDNIAIIGNQDDYYIQKDVIIEEFGQGDIYV
tara:strand:+ start:28 stop:861 length:834 start_codon:yes stop_codon:yes gene_type:complete